jgi:uncharacterized protein (TIGR02596 family)
MIVSHMKARKSQLTAFSLVELLVVVAIITVILALITPAVVPLLRASNINQSASMLVDELNLARQTALTQNHDVEVRFYQVASKSDPSDLQFRAFRSFLPNAQNAAAAQPLSAVRYLPEPVVISADARFSTLLDYGGIGGQRAGLMKGQETLPAANGPSTYISFLFRSTGGTNLTPVDPPDGKWFLTLYLENAPKNATTGIPDNYFTALVEPVTGRVRTFRP